MHGMFGLGGPQDGGHAAGAMEAASFGVASERADIGRRATLSGAAPHLKGCTVAQRDLSGSLVAAVLLE
jgi:hypothetical protein